MRCSPPPADASHGFTLLETLVALLIAIAAIAVLTRIVPEALGGARTAAANQEATVRAQSRLAALGNGPLVPGERTGDDGGGFAFMTKITTIAAMPPAHEIRIQGAPYASGTGLYDVAVTIAWGARAVTLRTEMLAPAQAGSGR